MSRHGIRHSLVYVIRYSIQLLYFLNIHVVFIGLLSKITSLLSSMIFFVRRVFCQPLPTNVKVLHLSVGRPLTAPRRHKPATAWSNTSWRQR